MLIAEQSMRDVTSMVSPLNVNPSGLDVRSGNAGEQPDAVSATQEDQFDVGAQPQIPEGHYVI